MKKIFISIALAAVASACDKDEDAICPDNPSRNSDSEITVNVGVPGLETKAPVTPGTSIDAVFVASTNTRSYSTYLWSDTLTFPANEATSSAMSFTPSRYYPAEGTSVYIKAFYPQSSPATTNNIVTYSATDGSVDVLLATEQSGTRISSPLNFVFKHQLSQLQFKFVAGAGFPAGKTVSKLIIKNQSTFPTQLDLNTDTLTYSATPITFSGKSYPIGDGTNAPITDCPMVAPGKSVVLSITTVDNVTYPDFTVPTLTTVVGQSHLITITFNVAEIKATVSVVNWVPGTGGGSAVQ